MALHCNQNVSATHGTSLQHTFMNGKHRSVNWVTGQLGLHFYHGALQCDAMHKMMKCKAPESIFHSQRYEG